VPDQTPAAGGAPAAQPGAKKKAPTSLKRLRQGVRRRVHNTPVRAVAKRAVARAVDLIEEGDAKSAREAVQRAISSLDRAAAKGVIHRNNAARRKSRLMHALQKPQAK